MGAIYWMLFAGVATELSIASLPADVIPSRTCPSPALSIQKPSAPSQLPSGTAHRRASERCIRASGR